MKEKSIVQEEFELRNRRGQVIRGIIFRPSEEGTEYPAVIFSHGFGADYRELMHHGPGYAENGIVCVFFDFCGGGTGSLSDGTMADMTVLTEAEDLDAVIDAVLALPYVKKESLFLQGESQGGLVSAIVGCRRTEDVKGLILWYPAFNIPGDAEQRLKIGVTTVFGLELSDEYDKAAISIDVSRIQKNFEKPVLLIHGDADPIVSIECSRDAEAVYPNAELKVIKNGGHGFAEKSPYARRMSIEFISQLS